MKTTTNKDVLRTCREIREAIAEPIGPVVLVAGQSFALHLKFKFGWVCS